MSLGYECYVEKHNVNLASHDLSLLGKLNKVLL